MQADKCPVCQYSGSSVVSVAPIWQVDCAYCGRYDIDADLAVSVCERKRRYVLSALTRQATERGERFHIQASHLNALETFPVPGILEVIDNVLRYMADRIGERGWASNAVFEFQEYDYPLFWSRCKEELQFVLRKATELGYLEKNIREWWLGIEGWRHLERLRTEPKLTAQAFVAMHFCPEMMQVYREAIAPALEECHWKPCNVGLIPHDDKICDLILAEIRRSGLMIADFTDHRNSVYFEAGFARGLGIPVISTCKTGQLDQLAFDTRQYKHLEWTNAVDLGIQLKNHLQARHPGPAQPQNESTV